MPLNYDLFPPRHSEIPGVGLPVSVGKANRYPIWESRLPRERSFTRRFDPLYDMSFNESHMIRFHSCTANVDYLGQRPDGLIGHRKQRWKAIVDGFTSDLFEWEKLEIMSLLGQFHTATTAQIASFLNKPFSETHVHLMRLHAHGLVNRAEMDWLKYDQLTSKLGHLWRIAYGAGTGPLVEQWLNKLDDFEYLMVTTGRDFSRGVAGAAGLYTHRHNIQVTEIMSRALEVCPTIAGVLGERPCGIENIMDTSKQAIRGNVGDGAIVGADGRIIIFELTTAKIVSTSIIDKARAWANAIALSPDLDVYVVFVNTNPIHDRSTYRRRVMYGVQDSEQDFANPMKSLRKAQGRIFVADARSHWFPSSHTVYEGFRFLEVYNPFYEDMYQLLPESLPWKVTPSTLAARAALSTPEWITGQMSPLYDIEPSARMPLPKKRNLDKLRYVTR